MGDATAVRVPGAARLTHGKSMRFRFERSDETLEGFVLSYNGSLYAYLNRCPHWSVDLDMGFGDFYDPRDDRIFCRTHGALFKPTDGFCDFGPCAGHSLQRFEVSIDGDDALVRV
jgi:nitrite reductase/ring-hydroxylating ferredoxin subunit